MDGQDLLEVLVTEVTSDLQAVLERLDPLVDQEKEVRQDFQVQLELLDLLAFEDYKAQLENRVGSFVFSLFVDVSSCLNSFAFCPLQVLTSTVLNGMLRGGSNLLMSSQ